MENKTCGECKYYNDAMFHCEKFDCMAEDGWSCPACEEKEKPKPTKGDKIRQMSNEELVKILGCARHLETCIHMDDDYPCEKCSLDWLNSPADAPDTGKMEG